MCSGLINLGGCNDWEAAGKEQRDNRTTKKNRMSVILLNIMYEKSFFISCRHTIRVQFGEQPG